MGRNLSFSTAQCFLCPLEQLTTTVALVNCHVTFETGVLVFKHGSDELFFTTDGTLGFVDRVPTAPTIKAILAVIARIIGFGMVNGFLFRSERPD
jgi:hypothetical protein